MMAAENHEAAELTNQQKFHNFRRKTIIEVRLISHAGAGEKWHEAVIKDTNKYGAHCQLLNSPGQRFWHWRDVRPCARTEMPRVSASLGEVARLHQELQQATEPPRRTPLPAPPALVAALAPVPPVSPPATLVRLARPEPEKSEPLPPFPLDGRGAFRVESTSELGQLIRNERLRLRLSQRELGKILTPHAGNVNSRISRIEVGDDIPNDDELLILADALRVDLDRLIAIRDRDRVAFDERKKREQKNKSARERIAARRQEKAAAEGREIRHRSSLYRDAPSAPASKPIAASSQRFDVLEDFMEALIAIVPMPADSEQRRAWFRCARELFEIAGS